MKRTKPFIISIWSLGKVLGRNLRTWLRVPAVDETKLIPSCVHSALAGHSQNRKNVISQRKMNGGRMSLSVESVAVESEKPSVVLPLR